MGCHFLNLLTNSYMYPIIQRMPQKARPMTYIPAQIVIIVILDGKYLLLLVPLL